MYNKTQMGIEGNKKQKEGIIYGAIVSHHGEPSVLCVIQGYGKYCLKK